MYEGIALLGNSVEIVNFNIRINIQFWPHVLTNKRRKIEECHRGIKYVSFEVSKAFYQNKFAMLYTIKQFLDTINMNCKDVINNFNIPIMTKAYLPVA